jgi:GTPase
LTFIDVAGNEKYAKTMIRGICCHYPDYALILVDAKAGLTHTTLDHFNLAIAFNVPLIVVINKIDLVKKDSLMDIKEDIRNLVKHLT